MATELYISLYDTADEVANGPKLFSDKVSVGAGSAASSALGVSGKSYRARVVSDTACQIERGANPTADGDSEFLPANAIEYFWWNGGDIIAVIEQQ